jgi:hypothetical protein
MSDKTEEKELIQSWVFSQEGTPEKRMRTPHERMQSGMIATPRPSSELTQTHETELIFKSGRQSPNTCSTRATR